MIRQVPRSLGDGVLCAEKSVVKAPESNLRSHFCCMHFMV